MNHTIISLEGIVETHNQNALSILAGARPAMFQGRPKLVRGYVDCASQLPNFSLGSWEGKLSKKLVPKYDLIRATLGLDTKGGIAAVFSVVDNFAKLNLDVANKLPVALCVGINYIQKPTYSPGLALRSDTEMRKAVAKVLNCKESSFHLVAANFFPWVTVGQWAKATGSGFNSLQELLVVETCGFDEPVAHIRTLAEQIDPEWIIFHGVDNCVPSLGIKVRNILRREVIFCDNISRRYVGNNAISF